MLLKWTQKQDQQLGKIIRKYGTNNWILIRKLFKSSRSRDSVIKRWHGKLKFEKPIQVKTKPIIKRTDVKSRIPPVDRRARQITRSSVQTEQRKNKSNMAQGNAKNNQFQRLRNFVEGTKGTRAKKTKQIGSVQVAVQQNDRQDSNISGHSSSISQMKLQWTKSDDQKLRLLVVQQGMTNWQKIGVIMGCKEKEVRHRWRKAIYQLIKLDDKVGGFLKYSTEEDTILTIGHRNGLSWTDLITFLPGRSQFSIEARWRRLSRPEIQVDLGKNRHFIVRQFLKKLIEKKRDDREILPQGINENLGAIV